MFERFKSKSLAATGAALLAALGVGGVAVAQSNSATTPTVKPASAPATAATTTAAEKPGTEQPDATEQSGSEKPGTEQPDANEAPEAPGSEKPGNDGPGGHADEPGNANANHQASGQE
jgi:hypothetical protein